MKTGARTNSFGSAKTDSTRWLTLALLFMLMRSLALWAKLSVLATCSCTALSRLSSASCTTILSDSIEDGGKNRVSWRSTYKTWEIQGLEQLTLCGLTSLQGHEILTNVAARQCFDAELDPEAIFNFDAGTDPTICTVYLSGQSIKILKIRILTLYLCISLILSVV